MGAYMVRVKKNRELVGIYVCDEPEDLGDMIDEITDPNACQYAEIRDGGVVWEGAAPAVPIMAMDEDDPDMPPGATLSERWELELFNDELEWEDVPPYLTVEAASLMTQATTEQ